MVLSLYDMTVGSYLQSIPPLLKCLDKGRDYCIQQNIDPNTLVDARLHPTMLPLHFQIITLVHFSEGAIRGAGVGTLGGPDTSLAFSYDELQNYLQECLTRLQAIAPEDINRLSGGEVAFQYGDVTLPFVTDHFFSSYTMPNFYFHVTTSYNILRSAGVPIGIANFIGKVNTTQSLRFPADVHQSSGAEYLEFLETLT